ncbi:MAG: hypothetical protein WBQ23_08330 [Bacteroidota bacterium]
MRSHHALLFILLGIAAFPSSLTAQFATGESAAADSSGLLGGPGRLSFGFERNVNTYLWDFGGSWRTDAAPWRISVDERFQRTLIRTDRSTVKDEQSLNIGAEHVLSDRLALTSSFSSFIFSDNRALALNDLSANKALLGARWTPFQELQVTPMAGVSFDNQQGIEDRGFMYTTLARLQDLTLGRTAAQAELYSSAEYIDPRFQQEHRGSADFLARFADAGLNHTQLQFRSVRREFYLPYDSALEASRGVAFPIESRDEQIVTLSNTLQYQMAGPLRLSANVDLTQRDIARVRPQRNPQDAIPFFDADISEFHLNGNLQLIYDDQRGTTGQLRMELNERDEVHEINSFDGANPVAFSRQQALEQQKNNNIEQTQLGLVLSHALSQRDTLWLSASTVKMQYDTPSEDNYDDRDELFVLAGLRWAHRFSPVFQASLSGDVNLRHSVFIFAERSANNTWNRVIRLSPATELRLSPSFVSRNAAEVVANYTVYDFESAGQSQRSFSLRQLTVSDSTLLRLGSLIWAEMQVHLRFYERGELRWTAFTLRPLQYFDERTFSLSLLRLGNRVRASLGLRYFEQRRYAYEGLDRKPAGTLRSYGPTASMRLRLSDATDIMAEGWYQLTSENESATRVTPNVSLRVFWNL